MHISRREIEKREIGDREIEKNQPILVPKKSPISRKNATNQLDAKK